MREPAHQEIGIFFFIPIYIPPQSCVGVALLGAGHSKSTVTGSNAVRS